MDDEIDKMSEYDARFKAAEMRMKTGDLSIQAVCYGEYYVIARQDEELDYLLTKPKWKAI